MKKFDFNKNNVELEIGEAKFSVNLGDPTLITRLRNFSQKAKANAAAITTDQDPVKTINDTFNFVSEALDNLLGAGATDEIFKGRKTSAYDAMDVLVFVVNTIQEEHTKKNSNYFQKLKR